MANNTKRHNDNIDASAFITGLFNSLFKNNTESNKEYIDKLNKMTKEQLIKEVLQLKTELNTAKEQLAQNNTIADAINKGIQQVIASNTTTGKTITADMLNSAISNVSYETTEEINKKLEEERELNKAVFEFNLAVEKYLAQEHREMLYRDTEELKQYNPYCSTAEQLRKTTESLNNELFNQNIFDIGYNRCVTELSLIDDFLSKKSCEVIYKNIKYRK